MLHATFSATRWCLPTPSDSCQSEEGVKSCFPPSDVSIKTTCSTTRTEYHDHLQHCMAQPFIAQVPRLSTNQWWKMMKMKWNWEIWNMMKHCRSGLENHVPPVPSAPSAPAAPLLILHWPVMVMRTKGLLAWVRYDGDDSMEIFFLILGCCRARTRGAVVGSGSRLR